MLGSDERGPKSWILGRLLTVRAAAELSAASHRKSDMAVAASLALIRIAGTKRDGHWDKPAEDDVEDLDALGRGAGVGIALLLGAMFWRARPRSQFAWVGLLWSAGVIGYLLWGHSAGLSWPLRVRFALVPLTLMSPFFFWAIVRMVFEDDFQLRAIHWVYFALIEVAGLAQFLLWLSAPAWILASLNYGHQLPSLALVVHAFWVVWRGRSTDLVESRARLRLDARRGGCDCARVAGGHPLYTGAKSAGAREPSGRAGPLVGEPYIRGTPFAV
jgi:hypothetical protein